MTRLRQSVWMGVAASILASGSALAGPVEFGVAEFRRAASERGLNLAAPATSTVSGKPECFTIARGAITGSDERGIMYGLLEAAEQIRNQGLMTDTNDCPAVSMRGIRYFLHNQALEKDWYYSKDHWRAYLSMLARNRFNRFNLVFAHQTSYLAPPYPFWLALPEFPQIRVPGLGDEQRSRNLEMLQFISNTAVEHGIDFTLGVWEHNIQTRPHKMVPTTEGITRENIGPYSHAALKKILQLCPAIRSVQMRTNEESGIPNDYRVQFYRDYVYTAIRDAGHPVYLDLRAWAVAKEMIEAAEQVNVPVRVSTKYWAEDVGRPYQPAETFPGYSYSNFLQKPRAHPFYWELWGLGSHRLLLWGNPQFVRRAASTFSLGDAAGFEIDPPLAQKGFGNRPGVWGIFAESQKEKVFWKWEFERYWMFYQLWGRLTYNPQAPDSLWLAELKRRFGPAAADVLEAYKSASNVLNEVVAAHLADPNMYIWPEINPGGLIDAYRDVIPSDWRYIASIPEAVDNRVNHRASAKQTARDTASLLNGLARGAEEAIARADKKVLTNNAEWRSSKSDFQVLALLARYHALKQTATDQVTWFDATGDRPALDSATRDLKSALQVWERLAELTNGVYPDQMAYGPDDVGHWKDKLPYVRHDLELVRQRAELFDKLGPFDFAFDFGGPVKASPGRAVYRQNTFVLANTVAPRFRSADGNTRYTDTLGYGWTSDENRTSEEISLAPYLEVRAAVKDPKNLPHDVLYRDFVRGRGPQVFRVKADAGPYTVRFLRPDRTESAVQLKSDGSYLDIPFPDGDWSISGLVVQGPKSRQPVPPQTFTGSAARPAITHQPPQTASANTPLNLTIKMAGAKDVASIRLYYRAVNQQAQFRMIEQTADRLTFTIPAENMSPQWDLMYYFEILNHSGGGWFHPDPHVTTPYHVVKIEPAR